MRSLPPILHGRGELRIAAGAPDGTLAMRRVFAGGADFTGGWTPGRISASWWGAASPEPQRA